MRLLVIISLFGTIGCGLFEVPRYHWSQHRPHIGIVFDDRDTDAICTSLNAVRSSGSQATRTFEKLGCCYNDGLTEPSGC